MSEQDCEGSTTSIDQAELDALLADMAEDELCDDRLLKPRPIKEAGRQPLQPTAQSLEATINQDELDALLGDFLDESGAEGLIKSDPANAPNKKPQESTSEKVLSQAEIDALFAALGGN